MAASVSVESLYKLQTVTYLHVSGTALLIVDYLITLPDEIKYTWNGSWNLGKVLFFLTRYSAFIDSILTLYHQVGYHLSAKQCVSLFRVTGWLIIFGVVVAEVILLIRIWALYQRSRAVGLFLIFIAVGALVSSAVGFVKFHGSQTFIAMDDISPVIPGCYPAAGTNIVYVDFLVLVVLESILLSMTIWKGIQHLRKGASSFVYTFYQDGILYYAVLTAISLVNAVVLFMHIREYTNLVTSLQRSLHSILSARTLLHLRREAAKNMLNAGGENEGGASTTSAVGELVFDTGRVSRWGGDTTWFGEGSTPEENSEDTDE